MNAPRAATIAAHLLDLASGLATLTLLALAIQAGWMYWGVTLDTTTTSRTIERELQPATPAGHTTDKTATLRTDDPPAQTPPAPGQPIGWIRIPTLGTDWRLPILEGTDQGTLDQMVAGHFTNTAMPGSTGNSAYAAHDTPGAFGALYNLPAGTQIIIETATTWHVYHTTGHTIVDRTQTSILDPDAAGTPRGLTLQTCWPMFTPTDTGQRWILHGAYDGWAPKEDGVPASLAQSHPTPGQHAIRAADTISQRLRLPITPTLALAALTLWAITDLTLWAATRRATLATWARPTWNPLTWAWRLQAGQLAGIPAWAAWIPRLIPTTLALAAATLAMWAWACPWAADTIPALSTPHPAG